MNTLILHLRIAGFLLMVLAIGHLFISRRFQWLEQSRLLSAFNGQVMLVHAFFIALTVGLMGVLALFWPETLVMPSALGRPVVAGLLIFWTVRLIFQWLVYDWALWVGKRMETGVHFLFTLFWIYLVVLFACCFGLQFGMKL